MAETKPRRQSSESVARRVPVEGEHLRELAGRHDATFHQIEEALGVRLAPGDGSVGVWGDQESAQAAADVLQGLVALLREGRTYSTADVRYALRAAKREAGANMAGLMAQPLLTNHRGGPVRARTAGQARFLEAAARSNLVFAIGPAGTGKTYLAMALAVAALREKRVNRIVLTRPIIEAGERLGFLPGDIMEKVEPYLRPLYDALQDLLGFDKLNRHRERGTIEVVPLAYMRGRTINDAFLVLDEAQNTTPAQMKMALTRLGLGSQMVVTGDPSQSDLPEGVESGLIHAARVLKSLTQIEFCQLTEADIVRHELVQEIVQAYDAAEQASRAQVTET